jgi:hypothetical protein
MKVAHVRVEVPGATINVSMFSLIATAKKFLEAARIVVAQESHQDGGWHPVGKYLACLSIELSLKAFLRLNGETMQNVGKYHHRITELLARARKENLRQFAKLTGPELAEIKKASKYYQEHVFRYPSIPEIAHAYPDDPKVAPLLSAAEKLVEGLYYPCRAAA